MKARCLKIIEALFKAIYTCYIYNTVFGRLRSKCINQSFLSSTSCTIECEQSLFFFRVYSEGSPRARASSHKRDVRCSYLLEKTETSRSLFLYQGVFALQWCHDVFFFNCNCSDWSIGATFLALRLLASSKTLQNSSTRA